MQDTGLRPPEEMEKIFTSRWAELEESGPTDWRLLYMAPGDLEGMRDAKLLADSSAGDFYTREGFEFSADFNIDMNQVSLTGKQMIAVSLVYFSRMSRAKAADAMSISTQSLSYHLKAATKRLKKSIERSLKNSVPDFKYSIIPEKQRAGAYPPE